MAVGLNISHTGSLFMYFKNIKIESVGPIEQIHLDFSIKNDRPLPIVIVGANGAGKSILLSHLVNSLIAGKQMVFEDSEVERGRVYKYRSPNYIKSGKSHFYSCVEFDSGVKVEEWQLQSEKRFFSERFGHVPVHKSWSQIPDESNSFFSAAFENNKSATEDLFKKRCCLYFPANRFEEPGWLNLENLKQDATYTELKNISGYSNRDIVCKSPLKTNKNWILDVILDRQAFDSEIIKFQPHGQISPPIEIFRGYNGQSTRIYEALLKILRMILRESGSIRLGAGTRRSRQIAIMKDEQIWIPNLFQLSTGETQLFNLFVSVVRDYDLSEGEFTNLSDIRGIVVIDEIDAHLHTAHQKEILPKLISSFPGIQFVITTHSPLFLIGMEESFGPEGFLIYNMPDGQRVAASDFSELTAAYDAFKETARHRDEVRQALRQYAKPIVFVEGDYDIRYIVKAAELLGETAVLERIQLKDGDGAGNLEKIWKGYNSPISAILPCKILLLFDCDTNKQNSTRDSVHKRLIPQIADNPIAIGIENLFPSATIEKLERFNPMFIDFQEQVKNRIRGELIIRPLIKSINRDEKANICVWLCNNGTAEDFRCFKRVFDIIRDVIDS